MALPMVASKCTRLGMRLCALELCSVLRYLALTCGEGCTPDRRVQSEVIENLYVREQIRIDYVTSLFCGT